MTGRRKSTNQSRGESRSRASTRASGLSSNSEGSSIEGMSNRTGWDTEGNSTFVVHTEGEATTIGGDTDFSSVEERGTARSSGKVGGSGWSVNKDVNGNWVARPYKREAIERAMTTTVPGTERRDAILANLKAMGVTAFIIDAQHAKTTADVMEHVHRVIGFVSKENRSFGPNIFQRCLLFQDIDGLLYNLVLPQNLAGQTHNWEANVCSFSTFQAMFALMILIRSLPCIKEDSMNDQLKPAIMSIILGLVMYEEISMSFLNSAMMVRACPSISAYALTDRVTTDWPRKLIVLMLALAGASTGIAQVWLSSIGIALAIIVLLSNLGSRAWYFFKWQPLTYDGPLASLYAYVAAVVAGLCVPFMSNRMAAVGDKPGVESIMRNALGLAVLFVVSDFDSVRKFLVMGAEDCHQDGINIFIGIWISLTLVVCVWMVARVEPTEDNGDEEPLLIEDQFSPVAYKVPCLPDYPIDPALAEPSLQFMSLRGELVIGFLVAGLLAGGVISQVFSDWEESLEEILADTIFS